MVAAFQPQYTQSLSEYECQLLPLLRQLLAAIIRNRDAECTQHTHDPLSDAKKIYFRTFRNAILTKKNGSKIVSRLGMASMQPVDIFLRLFHSYLQKRAKIWVGDPRGYPYAMP